MITAEKITKCAYLNSVQLESLLRVNYPKDVLIASKFLGITNGGQFCYFISFPDDEEKGGIAHTKVFVQTNSQGNLTCDVVCLP